MRIRILIFLLFSVFAVSGQLKTISGLLPQLRNAETVLTGFDGIKEIELGRAFVDSTGHFKLHYPASYIGAGIIRFSNSGSTVILLNKEDFGMLWTDMRDVYTLSFLNSKENDWFSEGCKINGRADQKLAAIEYLLPLYEGESDKKVWFQTEETLNRNCLLSYIKQLPVNSYARSYFELKRLLNEIKLFTVKGSLFTSDLQKQFLTIDYSDAKVWNSGLAADLISSYYQMVLSSHLPLDSVSKILNTQADLWMSTFKNNSIQKSALLEFCFKQLEKFNLLKCSEYLAHKALDESTCQLSNAQLKLFEQYRKMATGNIAPNIALQDGIMLSSTGGKYKFVIFGASWCDNCKRDYPYLNDIYRKLKERYDVEFVYVALDSDSVAYNEFFKDAPYLTICDFKGWENNVVKDYCVFATPSYFLLDRQLRIIAKLNHPEQLIDILQHI